VSVTPRTAVVHLIRAANGFAPFSGFIDAYERADAGCPHDLVLIFKGFASEQDKRPYLERAAAHTIRQLSIPDVGYDIGAYFDAANAVPHRWVCFMNSTSDAIAPGWLALLEEALGRRDVGVAGATGAWTSITSLSAFYAGLPSGYDNTLPATMRRTMQGIYGASPHASLLERAYSAYRLAIDGPRITGFPTPHIRCTAFLIDRVRFRSMRRSALKTKEATYRFETGRAGMTAQIMATGKTPIVVTADGVQHRIEDWPAADAFWQQEQRGLLVTDRQTKLYASASSEQRRVLSLLAWGDKARPGS
jgi:hypothetical protein